jgi:hypothetical protein
MNGNGRRRSNEPRVLLLDRAEQVILQILLSWNWLLSEGLKIFEVNFREGES